MGVLDALLFGVRRILLGGTQLPDRPTLNFDASSFQLTDNPGQNRIDVVALGGGGGGSGLPSASVAKSVLREDVGGSPYWAPMSLDDLVAVYAINSFALGVTATVEVNTNVATPNFTASYSSTPSLAQLTDDFDSGGATPRVVTSTPTAFSSARSFTRTAPGVTTFTLSAQGGGSPIKTRIAQLAHYQRIRYGTGAAGATSAASILALGSSPLAAARGGTYTFNLGSPGADVHAYIAFPVGMGTPTFKVGGFIFPMTKVAAAVSVTSNGLAQSMDYWMSDNGGLGVVNVDVT